MDWVLAMIIAWMIVVFWLLVDIQQTTRKINKNLAYVARDRHPRYSELLSK